MVGCIGCSWGLGYAVGHRNDFPLHSLCHKTQADFTKAALVIAVLNEPWCMRWQIEVTDGSSPVVGVLHKTIKAIDVSVLAPRTSGRAV